MDGTALKHSVEEVRLFNRFYTQQIGVLRHGLYASQFSLTQARVLYELAHRREPTAAELGRELGLDAGYLSRILREFEARKLITRASAKADARQSLLALTAKGQQAFAAIDAKSHEEVAALVGGLPAEERSKLVAAMRAIERLLGGGATPDGSFTLRPHQPGDMGWVVERHGLLYSREYGYDERFEALVADIVAEFLRHYDPKWERCWIAEKEGERIGSVFLVRKTKTVAKLRLLLVEPEARGLGLGRRLVDECVRFAWQVGYRKIMLWTQSELKAARRIYEQAGFSLVAEEKHRTFGPSLTAETWELAVARPEGSADTRLRPSALNERHGPPADRKRSPSATKATSSRRS